MAGYQPLKITGNATGLVQSREEFLLPNDAYPVLQNAYVFRERILRKRGCKLLGRLQRNLTSQSLGNTDGGGAFSGNIRSILSLEDTGQLSPTTLKITISGQTFVDAGDGTLSNGAGGTGTINYSTMALTLQTDPVLVTTAITAVFSYFPSLPVMGLRSREIASINTQPTIAFDTVYAYQFVTNAWREWIPGTTWTGLDFQFFWSTNFWVNSSNSRLFWVTNFNIGDPIMYSDGTAWTAFAPEINSTTPTYLQGCLAILPFRGRLVVFNTLEGTNDSTPYMGTVAYAQRVRWAAIGNPLASNAWHDDIRGQGGFLDIPTSESITAVGFVRDNLVIYCERSTWQLRYTQSSIAPFAIERVNSELGTGSLFSAVQFDTSLVGIGDKGIVECDSFQSKRIDIKILDLVFSFNQENNGTMRISGVRDFINKLAYWTYPYAPGNKFGAIYPNFRLVYNYENDSWAIFTDSYTCLGTFQPLVTTSWEMVKAPWSAQNYPWIQKQSGELDIVGGNQQGYVEYLDRQQINDVSLAITAITSDGLHPTVITVVNHNMERGVIIQISGVPTGTGYDELNGGIFYVVPTSSDLLELFVYNASTDAFDTPQTDTSQDFVGYGQVTVRDNFIIQSKKFNFMDEGQNTQVGYIDILTPATDDGAFSVYLYLDYNDSTPINTKPKNQNPATDQPDTFFNTIVPTSPAGGAGGTKYWQRIFCPVRGSFITIVYTLSNAQMVGIEQQSNVQIDAQVIWMRKAGRMTVAI